MDVKIVELQEQPTAVIREQVAMNALPEFFGRAFAEVSEAMEAQSVQPAGPPFALYRGMPTETVDVEAGFPVSGTIAALKEVQVGLLPACRAFQAMHVGSYDTLGTTYEAVKERMREEGLQRRRTCGSTTSATRLPTRQPGARWSSGRCCEAIRLRGIVAGQ